ncbi:pyridoxamine 5'-phosphate oxidase family protein [Candidatus Actinomarina]|jgi:PPOX class probable F420-dependent enzyme|nr:pyridoxamine 5'-phosphate oxidase family protein [Candidatus Actinomarina sp.]MDC1070860.1 pyridoxamine 5'-phosphate oxidase family protein [Acidimicrobiia bacterium]|tara:strand:+ start:6493 stop:6906 length:414 start_codon:yes stop_codon:yes gene_type:complete
MALDIKTIKMAQGPNYAALTTLFEDGSPQTHTMWVDTDGEHLLINTEIHRVKYKNIKKDPRVSVMIWKHDDAFKFVEVRGKVVDEITGDEAVANIQDLSEKYFGKPYPFSIQTERIVLKILAEREFFFNIKEEDFTN